MSMEELDQSKLEKPITLEGKEEATEAEFADEICCSAEFTEGCI